MTSLACDRGGAASVVDAPLLLTAVSRLLRLFPSAPRHREAAPRSSALQTAEGNLAVSAMKRAGKGK